MRVLFVAGEIGTHNGISPFIASQGKSLTDIGIELRFLILKGKGFLKYVIGVFQIKRLIKFNKIDIIHAHYSYAGWSAIHQKNIPVVVSLMGSDVLENSSKLKIMINRLALRIILKKANTIICKSKVIANHVNRKKNVFVIPNGIDLNFWKIINKEECRKRIGMNLEKKYILFASNPNRSEKNFKLAMESFKIANINDCEILITHSLSQVDLRDYYNSCDCLLLTSNYEGSPNVIKEAMACNLPIIATDVGDVRERIKNANNCYIVDPNPELIAEKLKIVLLNNNFVKNSREIIEEIEISKIANEIATIYNEILLEN